MHCNANIGCHLQKKGTGNSRYTQGVKKLSLLLIVIGLLAGGYVYASQNDLLPANTPKITVPEFNLQGSPQDQLTVLSSRAQELGGYAQNFVSSGIKTDETQPSLSQKALDYGQYLYCKQVVETYEQ